ncbi:MAG: sigma-70 family RNA polymerase sigma factor [Acidobacteriota bacterium]
MADTPDPRLTQLLQAWQQGNAPAGEQLVPLVYAELRRIARIKLGAERGGHTLQPTALVHEAWLRLMQQHGADWQNRGQFFAIATQAMRRILVDHARRRQAAKRGSGEPMASIDELAAVLVSPVPDDQLVALDAALERLAAFDPRLARVVELRFFGGLSVEETAEVLDLSPTTVKREWATARLWLFRAINEQTA